MYYQHMKSKNRPKTKPKLERTLTDDQVDAWEAENWEEIEAKLAEAEAAVAAGRSREVTVEQLMKEVLSWKQKRRKS
jgi:hypothetical protein